MTVSTLVILTSSPHIWGPNEIATGVPKEKWDVMKMYAVGLEEEEAVNIDSSAEN